MGFLLYTTHVVVSIFLILVVLLQQGKGADLSVFGGGSTMTAFGARGAASLLHKLTVGGFVIFIVTTLAIGVYQTSTSDNVIEALPSAEEAAAEAIDGGAGEAAAEPDLTGVLPEAEEFVSPTEGTGDEATEGGGEATEGEATGGGGEATEGAAGAGEPGTEESGG